MVALVPSEDDSAPLAEALHGRAAGRPEGAADSVRRAAAFLGAGRPADALAMLEYGQRLAPSDGGISLAIGLLRLALGDKRASEPLEMLAARTEWRGVRLALARVRLRFGQVEQAAMDLHAALSRSGGPGRRADIRLADTISARLGAQGWCALDNDGRLTVGAASGLPKALAIRLDGNAVSARFTRRPGGLWQARLPPAWPGAERIDVTRNGRKLLGSPLEVRRIARVEGFVEAVPETGALRGWCWFPAERDRAPVITVASAADPSRFVSIQAGTTDGPCGGDEFGAAHGFAVAAEAVAALGDGALGDAALGDAVTVTGPHGHALYGSPLWPGAAAEGARATMLAVARRFPMDGDGGATSVPMPRETSVPVALAVPRRAHPVAAAPGKTIASAQVSPLRPSGRRGRVRWGIPEAAGCPEELSPTFGWRRPTSPSRCFATGPALSPRKRGRRGVCSPDPGKCDCPAPSWEGCGIDVIIPVHSGLAVTLACIEAVRAHGLPGQRIVVVSDASPDREIVAALSALAARGLIVLHSQPVNRGFPATANFGLRLTAGRDAVLLNADALVTPGWLAGLRAAAHAAPDIGTATPLSNDATIFGYPRADRANPMPAVDDCRDLAGLAAQANGGRTVDVPTGHGFCLYVRADCLAETGLLREDLFAQGYGEENDFCMRARHLGWRHVAAPGVFVGHHGSLSFGGARDDLRRRNLETLNRLHVGYDRMIADWQRADPLGPSRRRIDAARLHRDRAGRSTTLLVTHDRGGGVQHYVGTRAAALARDGRHVLVLRPDNDKDARGRIAAHAAVLDGAAGDAYPNLRFRLPDEQDALAACLADCAIAAIEVSSLIGHAGCVVDLLRQQRSTLDVAIHDYSWFCPRITLTGADHRYCGEPSIGECRDCIAANGANLDEDLSPDTLIARSQRLMDAARAVVAPSQDAARRIGTRFGVPVAIGEWEAPREFDLHPVAQAAGRTRPVRVCVVGAIGPEKGYHTLLRCARLAAEESLPVEFVVVGHTCDDRRLLDTGTVRITGRYDEAEAVALIAAQKADLAWLPSRWPETWSYVLTRVWQAGLLAVVHDIGAPAERVRAAGGGLVVPLHAPPDRLVALFRDPHLFRFRREPASPRRTGAFA
jgi:GT2 family glycosyltransferase/glycosyltransferase involved in cell wall biosynthesis